MLEDAMEQARSGRAVYVVAATQAHSHTLEKAGGKEAHDLGIKFETAHSMGDFDWRTMSLAGAHKNCIVLADHYAIETEFSAMLEMLHRYDLKTPNVKLRGAALLRRPARTQG
jgi:hypothetical protein